MQQKTKLIVNQTALEKVLIKHQAMKIYDYEKILLNQAKKTAIKHCTQALEESRQMKLDAYQQGYFDGVQQLLTDFIQCLELSQEHLLQTAMDNKIKLETQLQSFFNEPQIQNTICSHFISNYAEKQTIQLYASTSTIKHIKQTAHNLQHVTLTPSQGNDITLKINNEIIHFSPNDAVNKISQLLTHPTRCIQLQCNIECYKRLAHLIAKNRKDNEDRAPAVPPKDNRKKTERIE